VIRSSFPSSSAVLLCLSASATVTLPVQNSQGPSLLKRGLLQDDLGRGFWVYDATPPFCRFPITLPDPLHTTHHIPSGHLTSLAGLPPLSFSHPLSTNPSSCLRHDPLTITKTPRYDSDLPTDITDLKFPLQYPPCPPYPYNIYFNPGLV
jgi:hypothetical protein